MNRYFGEIDEMMNDPPIPLLLINFDEILEGDQKKEKEKAYIFLNNAK